MFTYDSDLEVRSEASEDGSLRHRLLALRRFGRHLGKTKKEKKNREERFALFGLCLSFQKPSKRRKRQGRAEQGKSCDMMIS